MKKIITPTSLLLIDGDVLTTYMNPDVDFNQESSEENFRAISELMGTGKFFHMIVPDTTTLISFNVKGAGVADFEKRKKAEALVARTLGHRILAKAIMQERQLRYPVRIFETEAAALEWFDSLRAEEDSVQ